MPMSNLSEKSSHEDKKSKVSKKLVALSLVILMPCALLVGSQFMQSRARQGSSRKEIVDRYNASMNLSPELKALQKERAAMLRDKWRPWALEHQSELRRMLNASINDKSALWAVWDQIPNVPRLKSSAIDYVMALHYKEEDARLRNGQSFSWNAASKPGVKYTNTASAARQEGERRATTTLEWNLEENFATHRDIVISESIQTGTSGLCLWASGRVTEIIGFKNATAKDGTNVTKSEYREVQPPYEFLNEAKGESL